MSVKVRCLQKNRNHNGVIQSYILQDQNGQQIEVKRPQLLELLQNPNYDFIDLKLSADGKIIDKTEQPQELPTFIAQDYAASLFRNGYDITGKTKEEKKAEMKQCLQNEIATGKIDASKLGCSSDSLELVSFVRAIGASVIQKAFDSLNDEDKKELLKKVRDTDLSDKFVTDTAKKLVIDYVREELIEKEKNEHRERGCSEDEVRAYRYDTFIGKVTGYKLKNIGTKVIEYRQVNPHNKAFRTAFIQPGETKLLSRVEVPILLSRPEFSFRIQNAKVCAGLNREGIEKQFNDYYLSFDKGPNSTKNDILWLELPDDDIDRFNTIRLKEIEKMFKRTFGISVPSPQLYMAALVRHNEETIDKERMKQLVQEDMNSGILDKSNFYKSSDNLELVGIVRAMTPEAIAGMVKHMSPGLKNTFVKLTGSVGTNELNTALSDYLNNDCTRGRLINLSSLPLVGYKLKNVGSEPIPYKCINTFTGEEGEGVIQAGETKALTRVETINLLANPDFNFTIKNAKVVMSSSLKYENTDKYSRFKPFYLAVNDGIVYDVISDLPSSIWIELPEQDQPRFYEMTQQEFKEHFSKAIGINPNRVSISTTPDQSGKKPNIFNMFKK